MNLAKTKRGGWDVIEFEDLYGHSCSIQMSSLATIEAIWIGVNNPEVKVLAREICEDQNVAGWATIPLPENFTIQPSRMHLSRDQAAALIPVLQQFVNTGAIE